MQWDLPIDEGGSPVTGYKLYVNNILQYDGSTQSNVVIYTLSNLVVGSSYLIAVSAINRIGEGP